MTDMLASPGGRLHSLRILDGDVDSDEYSTHWCRGQPVSVLCCFSFCVFGCSLKFLASLRKDDWWEVFGLANACEHEIPDFGNW